MKHYAKQAIYVKCTNAFTRETSWVVLYESWGYYVISGVRNETIYTTTPFHDEITTWKFVAPIELCSNNPPSYNDMIREYKEYESQ
jgi:hypothetical protein